ncbi:hypothetical protein ElyMa_003026300 [Elysia marginata]|uniref:Uncharacterized protein n=1 Tax=Elysia marginata TaxID=1093978 RepID=A0AAV4IHA8_9GAST|nr:hypothetical protein ElyMa_003026300 [Elysia marginata]
MRRSCESNPQTPDHKSDAQTTEPRCRRSRSGNTLDKRVRDDTLLTSIIQKRQPISRIKLYKERRHLPLLHHLLKINSRQSRVATCQAGNPFKPQLVTSWSDLTSAMSTQLVVVIPCNPSRILSSRLALIHAVHTHRRSQFPKHTSHALP